MCLHQKNYKHKAAYFTGNQVKFSTPFRITITNQSALREFKNELSFCLWTWYASWHKYELDVIEHHIHSWFVNILSIRNKVTPKLKYRKEKREFIAELSFLSLLSELNDYFIFKRLYEYVYIVLYIVYTSRIRTFDTYQYYKANN